MDVEDHALNSWAIKKQILKINAPFRSSISKTNNMLIDNAEDLDIVMPIYSLLEYSDIYHLHEEVHGIIIEMKYLMMEMNNYSGNYRMNNDKTTTSKSFL